jgi:hypothetical protein
METNHESPDARQHLDALATSSAFRDGWSYAIDQPEHGVNIDQHGRTADWLSGYFAGRHAVGADDVLAHDGGSHRGRFEHVTRYHPGDPDDVDARYRDTDDIGYADDADDVEVHRAPVPNANALLHVPPHHPGGAWDHEASPNTRTPVRLDVALAHARERALERSNLGFVL